GWQHHRVLAALAYDAIALLARLSLHSARRQSAWSNPQVREPAHHDAARRPLAWSGLDVRYLGRFARALSCNQPRLAWLSAMVRICDMAIEMVEPRARGRSHIRRRELRLGFFPC